MDTPIHIEDTETIFTVAWTGQYAIGWRAIPLAGVVVPGI
jgi:hypothetical protein